MSNSKRSERSEHFMNEHDKIADIACMMDADLKRMWQRMHKSFENSHESRDYIIAMGKIGERIEILHKAMTAVRAHADTFPRVPVKD